MNQDQLQSRLTPLTHSDKPAQDFGALPGYPPGNVGAFSSDYDTASDQQYPRRSYYDGVYMGYKWQCVEFARRWLYINHGYIFDDVAMAYDIFELSSIRDLSSDTLLPFNAFRNGGKAHPEPGSLLIWEEGGEFEDTGHVAVVTAVTENYIRTPRKTLVIISGSKAAIYCRQRIF